MASPHRMMAGPPINVSESQKAMGGLGGLGDKALTKTVVLLVAMPGTREETPPCSYPSQSSAKLFRHEKRPWKPN